jgi:hypothetical protein
MIMNIMTTTNIVTVIVVVVIVITTTATLTTIIILIGNIWSKTGSNKRIYLFSGKATMFGGMEETKPQTNIMNN